MDGASPFTYRLIARRHCLRALLATGGRRDGNWVINELARRGGGRHFDAEGIKNA